MDNLTMVGLEDNLLGLEDNLMMVGLEDNLLGLVDNLMMVGLEDNLELEDTMALGQLGN